MPDQLAQAIHEALYGLVTDKDILRDFFAGCALINMSIPTKPSDLPTCAYWVYDMADAMLVARDKSDD